MENIALAKKIEYKKGKDKNQGKIIVEPLFPGYGITLGNSLRRVLLSSLPGAAPIGVKIEGINHEFMALAHLKEDILELILNIKEIRLKIFSDEIVKLKLEVHGKKKITAGDIAKNSSVEIVNPELVLGNLTDMAGSLKAEISVTKGMGYETVESRESAMVGSTDKKAKEIGFMEMDSLFSPVAQVGIDIENVRVGKMTNWDKLILNIQTDGTINPQEAFNDTVKILIKQFGAMTPDKIKSADDIEKEEEKDEKISLANSKQDEKPEPKDDKKDADKEKEEEPKKKRGRPKKIKN